jgi:hypothetical protein
MPAPSKPKAERAQPRRIVELTEAYEDWLREATPVVADDLLRKHEHMRESPFPFLRATYYSWAVLFPAALPEVFRAPKVAAVGDLHIENFGTWRDAEGRLAWGVNDFDEAAVLPYTNDLVRMACSAALAHEAARLTTPGDTLARVFLGAYEKCLREGGDAVVLADRHRRIGETVLRRLVRPRTFWKKKVAEQEGAATRPVPRECREVLDRALPAGARNVQVRTRIAGVGSLGRPRFVAVAEWNGGRIAREAKAIVPAATVFAAHGAATRASSQAFDLLLRASVRSPDPFLRRAHGWVVRRLAPDTHKIEIARLGRKLELELAALMGREVANVHLATPGAARAILADLAERPGNWLLKAAGTMAGLTEEAHKAWRKAHKGKRK